MAPKENPSLDYVQLHTHSKLSGLAKPRIAATSTPENLVKAQLEKKYNRPSLTDTDVFFGAWRFDSEARRHDVFPIIGTEQFIRIDQNKAVPVTIFPQSTEAFVGLFDIYNRRVLDDELMDRDDIERLSLDSIIITRGDISYFEDMLISNPNIFRAIDNAHYKTLEKELEYEKKFGKSVVTNEVRMASPLELDDLRFEISISGINQGLHATSLLHHSLKTPQEVAALYNWKYHQNQIGRSKEIAESLKAKLPQIKKFKARDIPDNLTPDEYLRKRVNSVLGKRGDYDQDLQRRVDEEMKYISSLEFSDYIVLCLDQVEFAKQNNFEYLVTGSGNQSVVLELLGMTRTGARNRDFTRFINPDREDLPDIDIKFSKEHRNDVAEYVLNKYKGEALPLSVIHHFKEDGIVEESRKRSLELSSEEVKGLAQAEHVKNVTLHQSGIVFIDTVALRKNSDGIVMAQIERDDADKLLRIPKVDILTDTGLSRLEYIKHLLREKGLPTDIETENQQVLRRVFKGGVIGITNLESPHMWNTIRMIGNMKSEYSMQDIADALAIARPRFEARNRFYNKNHAKDSPLSKHPVFVEILGPTNMTVTTQDQIIAIAKEAAGFTGLEAEKVKKLASDKISESDKAATRDAMREGLKNNGYSEKVINDLISQIQSVTYGFLDGHASTLASESYELAFFAEKYPEIFWTGVFDNLAKYPESISSQYTLQVYVNEAIRKGMTFAFPHPSNLKGLPRLHKKNIIPGAYLFKKNFDYDQVYSDLKNPELSLGEKIHSQLDNLGISFSDVPIYVYPEGPFFDPEEDTQWIVAHLESRNRTGRVILDSGQRINAISSPYRVAKFPKLYKDDFWYVRLSRNERAFYSWTIVDQRPVSDLKR